MSELSPEIETLSTMFSGDLSNPEHIDNAASRIAAGHVVAIDNDAVWALWGDAAQTSYVGTVQRLKGRSPSNRFGLTMPFSRVAQFADLGRIHPDLHRLFEDPQHLTDLTGGLAFVRFPVAPPEEVCSLLGETVLSADQHGQPLLQNYDPCGKKNIELLVQQAMAHGALLPAASSMNVSGEAEIMTVDGARDFMRRHTLTHGLLDSSARRAGSGSYAILEADVEGFRLLREGNISTAIIERLLAGLPFRMAESCKSALGKPLDGLDEYSGVELRHAVIEAMGWDRLSA